MVYFFRLSVRGDGGDSSDPCFALTGCAGRPGRAEVKVRARVPDGSRFFAKVRAQNAAIASRSRAIGRSAMLMAKGSQQTV